MEFCVYVHPKAKVPCVLKVDEACVAFYPRDDPKARKSISLCDVTGADLKRSKAGGSGPSPTASGNAADSSGGAGGDDPAACPPQSNADRVPSAVATPSRPGPPSVAAAAVTLFHYPAGARRGSLAKGRKRQSTTFLFCKPAGNGDARKVDDDDERDAEKFFAFVKASLKRGECLLHPESRQSERFSKKVLVLINPKSGSGKAAHVFQHLIQPMFDEAGVVYDVKVTDHAGHATEIAQQLNIDDWYGIVIVSGDGLAFEVYQGLMSRPDWQTAVRIPIGVLPGGSGNALSCAVNYAAGEPVSESSGLSLSGPALVHATYVLLKHDIVPMDLVAVDTLDGRVYSFLSVTWGIIADVDVESEKYRSLGNLRFTIGAVARILNLRRYRGKVSFLPLEPYSGSATGTAQTQSSSSTSTASASQQETVPGAASADGSIGRAEPSRPATASEFTMPGLDEPVPADWVTIDDEFITVAACYLSHLGPDAVISPDMTFDAGYIELVLMRSAGTSRAKVLQVFNQLENPNGELQQPGNNVIERIRIVAFRIDPEPLRGVATGTTTTASAGANGLMGNVMVDGERVRYGRVQGRIMPAAAQLMAKRKQVPAAVQPLRQS